MEESEFKDTPEVPEHRGKYTKAERQNFDKLHGPGTAVALESIRKLYGLRIKITRTKPSHRLPTLDTD